MPKIMNEENFEVKFVSLALDVAKAIAAFQKNNKEQLESTLSANALNREMQQELKAQSPVHFGTDSSV